MTPELYSALASAISALCALYTLYMFRLQGKGLVWTKDASLNLLTDGEGKIHLQIDVPLFNFGKGTVKFISLRAKKIDLKTKVLENFDLDMDEAYFPEGSKIISYSTA